MPKFSKKSLAKLETCHPDLRRLFHEVIKNVDCTIIEGVRSEQTQIEYVRTGKSKTMNSKHLEQADGYSHAADVMVYPIDWNNWKRNYLFAGYVKGIADKLGIDLRMGSDWDGDMDPTDQSFHDLPHFELKSTSATTKTSYLPDGPDDNDINVSLEDIENEVLS